MPTAPSSTLHAPSDTFTSARNPKGKKPVSLEAIVNEDQRTNVPFDAGAWNRIAFLSDDDRDILKAFHLQVLEERLSNKRIAPILGYDASNIGRILKGNYSPDSEEVWLNIVGRALNYLQRGGSRDGKIGGCDIEPEFILTGAGDRYLQAFDYASRGGFAMVVGNSGAGKTKTSLFWESRHPGCLIRVEAPITGGPSALIRDIARLSGMGWRKRSSHELLNDLKWRLQGMTIFIEEGNDLIPGKESTNARSLRVIRRLYDNGIGIVLCLTWRAIDDMTKLKYQIEQEVNRAEIFSAPDPTLDEVRRIAMQFGDFKPATIRALFDLVYRVPLNGDPINLGFRDLTKILDRADRARRKLGADHITDEMVAKVLENRFDRMGGSDPFADVEKRVGRKGRK